MRIIEINALSNGAHRNQVGSFPVIPTGWAVIPDSMAIPDTFPFVTIVVQGSTVAAMAAGTVPEPEPQPEPAPTEEDDTASMLVDHEYRLTLLELGLTEE